jgi:hypothetical protein
VTADWKRSERSSDHSGASYGLSKGRPARSPGGVYDIQAIDGHYLTAVGGGGRITDTIRSDVTTVGAWEKFTVTCGN